MHGDMGSYQGFENAIFLCAIKNILNIVLCAIKNIKYFCVNTDCFFKHQYRKSV